MGFVDAYEIMSKENEKLFESDIEQFKKFSQEQLINEGTNAFAELMNYFTRLCETDPELSSNPKLRSRFVLNFVRYAHGIACAGMDRVTEKKQDIICKFYASLGEVIKNSGVFFEPGEFTSNDYDTMIQTYLCASMEPFTSPYIATIYKFLIACTVAESVNESGLDKLRKLRKDYIAFVHEQTIS